MPNNEQLTDRLRELLSDLPKVEEKKMFGGIAFMVDEKMCITVRGNRIMCRIDPALHDEIIQKKECRTVIMKGRELKGYIYIDDDSLNTKKELQYWVLLALDYNKKAKSSKKKK